MLRKKVIKIGPWSAYWKDKEQGYHIYLERFGKVCIFYTFNDFVLFCGTAISLNALELLHGFIIEIKNIQ